MIRTLFVARLLILAWVLLTSNSAVFAVDIVLPMENFAENTALLDAIRNGLALSNQQQVIHPKITQDPAKLEGLKGIWTLSYTTDSPHTDTMDLTNIINDTEYGVVLSGLTYEEGNAAGRLTVCLYLPELSYLDTEYLCAYAGTSKYVAYIFKLTGANSLQGYFGSATAADAAGQDAGSKKYPLVGSKKATPVTTPAATSSSPFQSDAIWPARTQSGGFFNLPTAIARDNQGIIYIINSGSSQVKVLNEFGELLRTWGGFGEGEGQFRIPWGIAVTPQGEVLVADSGNNRIQAFTREGQFIRQWGNSGISSSLLSSPLGIAVDKQGSVYVVDSGNKRIQIYDSKGGYLRSIVFPGIEPGSLSKPLNIAVNSAGELFITDELLNQVWVLSKQGNLLRRFGKAGTGDGQFARPQGIAIDDDGFVYVSEADNNRIQVFDRQGNWVRKWGELGILGANFRYPAGLLADSSTHILYVADGDNHRIQRFDFDGTYLGGWQSQGSKLGEFAGVFITASPQGEVYAADIGNHRIQVFSKSGKLLRVWGQQGTGPGQFNSPSHVVLDAQGLVYVADAGNNRVQIFNSTGQFLKEWKVVDASTQKNILAANLAVTADGLVYMTDRGAHRVDVFSKDGLWLTGWGSEGSAVGQFQSPNGIVVDSEGLVYVADQQNSRVQVFDSQGKFLRKIGSLGNKEGQFLVPSGLSISPAGLLFVSDALNNGVQVFKRDGTFIERIGSAGTQAGQFGLPFTIALLDENTFVVGEFANNRIQVMTRKTLARSTFKAILLAGGGPSTETYTNNLWDSTQLLTNNAYFALRAQGFNKDAVKYLSSGTTLNDLDGNGQNDDIENATLNSLGSAITEWAKDANDVLIFLGDHGGDGKFKINEREILTREQLATWLGVLDKQVPGKITIVIEACQSGSFFSSLANPKHILISSASKEQPAVISNQGLIAFSYYFWNSVHTGDNLQSAFKLAQQGIGAQTVLVNKQQQKQYAQMEANGDNVFDEQDYVALGDYCLGKCQKLAADEPSVTAITSSGSLNGQTRATLKVKVQSLSALQNNQAFALIGRPDVNYTDVTQPITDLPKVLLPCGKADAEQMLTCAGEYEHFDVNGDYFITFYAQDDKGRLSQPRATITLHQGATQGQSSQVSTLFDGSAGVLHLQDVLVEGQHYEAFLKLQNNQLSLTSAQATALRFTSPAQYDAVAGVLHIPEVTVAGQRYQANLKHIGNYVFTLLNATPLSP